MKKKIVNGSWTFGKNIPKNFDKHIFRSVPGYLDTHRLICELSTYFLSNNSKCYDVGFSTGTLITDIFKINKDKNISIIGIEPEKNMVEFFKKSKNFKRIKNLKIINKNVENSKIEKCDLIISHYTLQFIRKTIRHKIIKNFFKSLNSGGAFILFEKIYGNNSQFEKIFSDLLTDFKMGNKFSEIEIINKNKAIRGVLNPLTISENMRILEQSGFKKLQIIYQNINFIGILAIK